MRLVFMGTPDFAASSLRALSDAGHEIIAVYCQPDKPKGRGLTLTPPPVKVLAQELGLPVYQPARVKDEQVCAELVAMQPDCIAVVAYGKLLPKPILDCAKYGCINVHSSLLPKYRGSAPIQWSILNGEDVTGVSTMLLDEGMDTGDILLQESTPIDINENVSSLHDRLADMGARLLCRTLEGLENGSITPIPQDNEKSCHAPMLDKSLCPIDWSLTARQVHDKVRGLAGWPVAETKFSGTRVRVHQSRISSEVYDTAQPGQIVCLDPLTVQCGEGAVELIELQADGSKRMKAEDYLRGHRANIGDILG